MNKVTVTGNIISRNGITLFMTDGSSQVMSASDYKTQAILDAVLPSLSRSQPIEIDLDSFSIQRELEKTLSDTVKIADGTGAISLTTKHGTVRDISPLKSHLENAAWNNGGKGLKMFLSRFAVMAKERKHSAEELMTFLEGADLPLADDGSIIGYKILGDEGDHMIDHHSHTVKQKLGSLVYMPASKITGAGREACGVGLHIAARKYIDRFYRRGSSRLCLVKIKADDVVSVPPNERTKMRVCAYHIVAVLNKEDGDAIARGTPIEQLPEASKTLQNVVAGNHVTVLQRVEINGRGELTVTDLESKGRPARKNKAVRPLKGKAAKITVADVKAKLATALPYEKKLAKAQKAYDDGLSIREIAKKFGMDRESLGKNLVRRDGR